MKGKAPGQGMREYNWRCKHEHPCEGCKTVMLPPSSLRYCADCRKLLSRVLT